MKKIKVVKPIVEQNKIDNIENYLKSNSIRNYILFLMAIHTGLRIGDILKLKVENVLNKENIEIREEKTGKTKEIEISPKLKRELKKFCENKPIEEYLIKSRNCYNNPLGRKQAYNIIRDAGAKNGLKRIGCHSLRKTFGRKYYNKYNNIEELRVFFNHSNSSITLRYIGLEQEVINKHVKELWS